MELSVSFLCREPRKRYNYGENICLIYENQAQKGFVKLSITAFLDLKKKKKSFLGHIKLEYFNKTIKWVGEARHRTFTFLNQNVRRSCALPWDPFLRARCRLHFEKRSVTNVRNGQRPKEKTFSRHTADWARTKGLPMAAFYWVPNAMLSDPGTLPLTCTRKVLFSWTGSEQSGDWPTPHTGERQPQNVNTEPHGSAARSLPFTRTVQNSTRTPIRSCTHWPWVIYCTVRDYGRKQYQPRGAQV